MTASRIPHSGLRPPPRSASDATGHPVDDAPTVEFTPVDAPEDSAPELWVPPVWLPRPAPEPKARIERRSARARSQVRTGSGFSRPARLGVLGVAAVAVIAVTVATVGNQKNEQEQEPTVQATATTECEAKTAGPVLQGNGAGGTDSGPEVIFGFQHAYYVARSGAAARSFVAPEVVGLPADGIQSGIDSATPMGTTHCVTVAAAGADRYAVTVTESHPAGDRLVHNQIVTTRTDPGGRTWITSIAKA